MRLMLGLAIAPRTPGRIAGAVLAAANTAVLAAWLAERRG